MRIATSFLTPTRPVAQCGLKLILVLSPSWFGIWDCCSPFRRHAISYTKEGPQVNLAGTGKVSIQIKKHSRQTPLSTTLGLATQPTLLAQCPRLEAGTPSPASVLSFRS